MNPFPGRRRIPAAPLHMIRSKIASLGPEKGGPQPLRALQKCLSRHPQGPPGAVLNPRPRSHSRSQELPGGDGAVTQGPMEFADLLDRRTPCTQTTPEKAGVGAGRAILGPGRAPWGPAQNSTGRRRARKGRSCWADVQNIWRSPARSQDERRALKGPQLPEAARTQV